MKPSFFFAAAAVLGGLAVMLGAAGAHAFKLSGRPLEVFETATRYQLLHALVLAFTAFAFSRVPGAFQAGRFVALGFLLGMLLFCGNLYLYVFTDARIFARLTPIGGVLLILAWFALAFVGARRLFSV